MLGKELNSLKQSIQSKSSILHEDMDEKKLAAIIEDKDRTIRRLNKKIEKLEESLKRALNDKNSSTAAIQQLGGENVHLKFLKTEMDKTQRLEEIIKDITHRVNAILEEISHDHSISDNSSEIREILQCIDVSGSQGPSYDYLENELQKPLNISAQWSKKIDLLEGTLRTLRNKYKASFQTNKLLSETNDELKRKLDLMDKKQRDNQQAKLLISELKEEKKQRQKLKKLLQKSQYEKNELVNKINLIGLKQADVKAKTKDQLLQYSKQLHYRIKDLQKEKQCLLKEATKDKEEDLKKYQNFLKKLKVIKEKSFVGKSCA